MQERVKYDEIRNLADRKHSWSKYFFGVAVDIGEQSANNKHYISNVIFPLIPIALASISVVVAGATALSTLVFGAIAFITSAYQAKRAKEGMDEKTHKLKKEMAAFEEEIIQLVRLYQELEIQRQAKILSAEFIDEEQSQIADTFRVLLDHIDLGGKSRSQKLYHLLQRQKIDGITATIDKICQKMAFGRGNRDDHAIQTQLSGVLKHIEKPRPMNPHIRRLLYAGVGLGGLSLGFGLGFAVVSTLVLLTFPWSILPAIGAGLIMGGIFLARYHFIKRGAERDQAEMKLAKGQVKGLKHFVSKIYTEIENRCTNLFDRESAKQEKTEEMQVQVEQERITIRKEQEVVERREQVLIKEKEDIEGQKRILVKEKEGMEEQKRVLVEEKGGVEEQKRVLVKEKESMEEQKRVLEESQLNLYRSIKIFHEAKDQMEIERKSVLENENILRGREQAIKEGAAKLSQKETMLDETKNKMDEENKVLTAEKAKLQERGGQLDKKEHQFEEKFHLFEAEKIKFQKEYTQRDEIWKEREARIDAKEKALAEREKLLVSERNERNDKLLSNGSQHASNPKMEASVMFKLFENKNRTGKDRKQDIEKNPDLEVKETIMEVSNEI